MYFVLGACNSTRKLIHVFGGVDVKFRDRSSCWRFQKDEDKWVESGGKMREEERGYATFEFHQPTNRNVIYNIITDDTSNAFSKTK